MFQHVLTLPTDLNFEEAARVSVSSNSNGGSTSNDPNEMDSGEEENNGGAMGGPEMALSEALATTLDYLDMIIYTVLETLQGKVS